MQKRVIGLRFFIFLLVVNFFCKQDVFAATHCQIYPISLPASLVGSGQNTATAYKKAGFSWLTWGGDNSAAVLASSLIPPGNSHQYINPYDPTDHSLTVSKWVKNSPGVKNSKAVRDALNVLIGKAITLPFWVESKGQGSHLNYKIKHFGRVVITAYNLSGQGWLSFDYQGEVNCGDLNPPDNQAPVAEEGSFKTEKNVAIALKVIATDPENQVLSYSIVQGPRSGRLTGTGPDYTYTPNQGFIGADSFTYKVNDTKLDSNLATIKLEVIDKNDAPQITSQASVNVNERAEYSYDLDAIDPNAQDVLQYSIVTAPAGSTINAQTGLLSWSADSKYVQSVPVFNNKCYVQPDDIGSVDNNNTGVSYLAPLYQRVKTALHNGSDYTASRTKSWDTQNACLGCHVQTQTLIGLQTAKQKAVVDEETAEFLLNRILSSQQVDGAIYDSNAWFAKAQTAYALWSLSYVPERSRTLDARAKALRYFYGVKETLGNTTFWVSDYSEPVGWLQTPESITALIALSASRFILDAKKTEGLTPEQQTVLSDYQALLPNLVQYFLSKAVDSSNASTLNNAFILIGLGEMKGQIIEGNLISAVDQSMKEIDQVLRSRQTATGGWSYHNDATNDPLISAWVGLALNYLQPAATDQAILNTIQYLLDTQNADGFWVTTSGLFSTHLATTSLVMAYLPVLLDHLSSPDVIVNNFKLNDETMTLSVDIYNRGLGKVVVPIKVSFYNDDPAANELLASAELASLAGDSLNTMTVSLTKLPTKNVYAVLSVAPTPAECDISNNQTVAVLMKLAATDPQGLKDEQSFLVNVLDVNEAPSIISTPVTEFEQGLPYAYQVKATDPDRGDALNFKLTTAPAGLSIDAKTGLISYEVQKLLPGKHPVVVTATDLRGLSAQQTFELIVHANALPTITSSPITEILVNKTYHYSVIAEDTDGDTLAYSLMAAPLTMTIDSKTGVISWDVQSIYIGNHTITVKVSDGRGGEAEQSFTLRVSTSSTTPIITSTPPNNLNIKTGLPFNYQIEANDPEGGVLSFSLTTAPQGMQIDVATGQVTWIPTTEQIGDHLVTIRVTDNQQGYVEQSFTLNVEAAPINQAPLIHSAPVITAFVEQVYYYAMEATDPDEGDTLAFALISAPTGMGVDAQSGLITWTPSPTQLGEHTILLKVSDGKGGEASQTYTLVVKSATTNQAPHITSTPAAFDQVQIGSVYRYQILAEDPEGQVLTYQLLEAPEGMTISAEGLVQWQPTSVQTVAVKVSVSDGNQAVTQAWSLAVTDQALPLIANLTVSPTSVNEGEKVTLTASIQHAVEPIQLELLVDGQATTFTSPYQLELTATGAGKHTVQLKVTDANTSITKTAEFNVKIPGDTTPPIVNLTELTDGSRVTMPTVVKGSIEDEHLDSWRLSYKPMDTSDAWVELAQGSTAINAQALATFDPTLLMNGQYELRLEAIDLNGLQTIASAVVTVEGEMKVGLFSISFKDLEIPLTGIPITVTRTYDSRQSQKALDFGQGWSIDYRAIKVEEDKKPGLGWQSITQGSGLSKTYCTEPIRNRYVTVTLPTGEVERFIAEASPHCTSLVPTLDVTLGFRAVDGTKSTLEQSSYGLLRVVNGNLEDIGDPGVPVDPQQYKLTTRSGYVYMLDQAFGLQRIIDPKGNSLTYSDAGILHSSGVGIQFERDALGRITAIVDPKGNKLHYSYSATGDLIAAKDRAAVQTSFSYDAKHYLTEIIDPLGRKQVKNIYNEEGRLVSQEDNAGKQVVFNYNIPGRQSVVTDRNGNTSTYYYDERGNVTTQVDALGHQTLFTYDANDNQLTRQDPLGHIWSSTFNAQGDQLTETNPLNQTTNYTYNTRGDETEIKDPLGYLTKNTYDTEGSLLQIENPLGQVTHNTLNGRGEVTELTDALGYKTTYTYDSKGNRLTETDATGVTKSFTYDVNGNKLTETRTRLIDGVGQAETTHYEYDAADRVTQTTNALGHTTQTELNDFGKVVATIDELGRRTETDYDAYGRDILVRMPDGSEQTTTYDAEGNKLTETDAAGRTTRYEYDALNRLVKTTSPIGAVSTTEYDANGRVVAHVDALDHRTTYEYDAAGRRTAVTNALGQRNTTDYDAAGRIVKETDALGHTQTHTYNAAGQRISTTYADLSTISTTLDALAHKIGSTDQAGITTQFAYDALGRLVKVTDAAGHVTAYRYDEVGSKLSQTDALGRVTRWSYDALGRVLSRTLPLGQTEHFSYDAVGNRSSHTDFNGQTHTYTYDSQNRVTDIQYADGSQETTQYDAVGNRTEVTLIEGSLTRVWRYRYDEAGRLNQETQPDGSRLSYSYDLAGNKTKLITVLPSGATATTTYSYDALNRLKTVTDATGTTRYSYDAVGNRSEVVYPNQTWQRYSYDVLNRLTQLEVLNTAGQVVQSYRYTLDATGRRTQITEASGRTRAYSYDHLYRLTSEDITEVTAGHHSSTYHYDPVGNRIDQTVNGVQTAYSYDENDRLLSAGGVLYAYDAQGNTLSQTDENGQLSSYTYNSRQQRIGHTVNGQSTSYAYNPEGIRTQQTSASQSTHYLVDQNRDYAQVLAEYNSTGLHTSYSYGDDLISQTRSTSPSTTTTHYYHYDGLGSTRALSDASGALTDTYAYAAFGELLQQTGTTENHYRFAGEQYDAGLDQYYLRARYYDQGVGRFTQQDTWMGRDSDPITLHKYLYANSDPVNHIDPTGQFGLASFSVSINSVLTAMTIYDTAQSAFQFASGEREFTAKEVGIAIIWAYAGTKTGLISKPFEKFLQRSGCLSNSFSPNTLVASKDGLKRIDNIKIDDLVLSYIEETGERDYKPVIAIIKNEKLTELILITLESGERIEVTPDHLFFLKNRWAQAREIEEGDVLKGAERDEVKVTKTGKTTRIEVVFDLTVKRNHNFYISKDMVLVHNISPCEKAAQALAKAVPSVCKGKYVCDDFAVEFEKLLLERGVVGKRLCVKSKRSNFIGSIMYGNISKNNQHFAVQIGEMVFDNLNPEGIPFAEWADDIGINDGIGIEVSSEDMTGNYNGCIPGK